MKKTIISCALASLAFGLCDTALADIFTFQTQAPPGDANHQATAEFNFIDANTLQLTLSDTGNIIHLDSILTNFEFDLNGVPASALLGTITAPGGHETCSTTTGQPPHITTCSNDGNTDATGQWSLALNGSSIVMKAGGKLHPFGIANDTFAPNAISQNTPGGLSNGQHNPALLGDVEFDITFTGLTSIPTISDVQFSFGTQPLFIAGQCTSENNCQPLQETPEPQSLLLVALGMLGLLYVRLRLS